MFVLGINECKRKPCKCLSSKAHSCAQCVDTYGSYQCKCAKGYRLLARHNTCVDHNECLENPNICDQECENFEGGYRCICFKGYTQNLKTKKCFCEYLNNFWCFLMTILEYASFCVGFLFYLSKLVEIKWKTFKF